MEAEKMPDTTDTLSATDRVYDDAPEAFALQWEFSRSVNGGRRIFVAADDTDAFSDAYRHCRGELRALGFSFTAPQLGDNFQGMRPCFWLSPEGWSPAALAEAVALAPVRIEAARVEREARDAEAMARWEAREAAERREKEAVIERAKSEAARSLGSRRWSWVRPQDIEEAEGLIADPALDAAGAKRLNAMVKRAKDNVRRTEDRVAVVYGPERALASDPAVRVAAADALAHVTALDADRAMHRNDLGWSRATTLVGHVLTGKGELDEVLASHAIRIIRVHHGQVPVDLLARVLGAPAQVAA